MSAFRRAARSGWLVVDIKHTMGQDHKFGSSEIIAHKNRVKWCTENTKEGTCLASITNMKFRYAFKNHSDATMFRLAWL